MCQWAAACDVVVADPFAVRKNEAENISRSFLPLSFSLFFLPFPGENQLKVFVTSSQALHKKKLKGKQLSSIYDLPIHYDLTRIRIWLIAPNRNKSLFFFSPPSHLDLSGKRCAQLLLH